MKLPVLPCFLPQGFLSVLQGRMDGKASTDDVDSLRRGHQSISEKIVTIENRLDEVNKVSNATKELTKQVSSIEKRLSAVEARPVPAGGPQQVLGDAPRFASYVIIHSPWSSPKPCFPVSQCWF